MTESDNSILLNGKSYDLPFTANAMMMIGSHPKGLQGVAQSVRQLYVPDMCFVLEAALKGEKNLHDADWPELLFSLGSLAKTNQTLSVYLMRLAHGGKTLEEISKELDATNEQVKPAKKKP